MNKIDLLKKLGLTDYEAKVYFSLAKLGVSGVKEIVANSFVPRNKVYEALNKLEKKQMISTIPLSPKKFKIINSKKLQSDILTMQKETDNLIELIETPKNINNNDDELFHIIKSKRAIETYLSEQNQNVKNEIIGSNYFSSKLYKNIKVFRDIINQKGINVRLITPFKDEYLPNYIANMKVGVKIRIFDEKKFKFVLPRMSIFDKKTTRLTIGKPEVKDKGDYTTIWTTSQVYSKMFAYFLEQLWEDCEPIEDYCKRRNIVIK